MIPRRCLSLLLLAAFAAGLWDTGAAGRDLADDAAETPRATVRAFAEAVLSGRTARMCALLRGQARRTQGCGTSDEDFGPMLRLTIRRPADVRPVEAARDEAWAAFPRLGRAGSRPQSSWCRPQLLRLRRIAGRWWIVQIRFGSDYEPVTEGCHGRPAAAAMPRLSLPAFNAWQGRCPRSDPEPLGPSALRQARRAALRQAPLLYRGTDLTGMRIAAATRAVHEDPGRGGYARVKCGRGVQRRTVVVHISFPAMRPSASLSQGVVLVSRLRGAYRVWAALH